LVTLASCLSCPDLGVHLQEPKKKVVDVKVRPGKGEKAGTVSVDIHERRGKHKAKKEPVRASSLDAFALLVRCELKRSVSQLHPHLQPAAIAAAKAKDGAKAAKQGKPAAQAEDAVDDGFESANEVPPSTSPSLSDLSANSFRSRVGRGRRG